MSHIDPLFISSSSDTTLLPPSKKPYSKYRSDPDHVDIEKATRFLSEVLIVAEQGCLVILDFRTFEVKSSIEREVGD